MKYTRAQLIEINNLLKDELRERCEEIEILKHQLSGVAGNKTCPRCKVKKGMSDFPSINARWCIDCQSRPNIPVRAIRRMIPRSKQDILNAVQKMHIETVEVYEPA